MNFRRLAGLALALVLAACSGILPKPAAPPALFRLTAASDFPAAASLRPIQLAVAPPSAEAALDTTRIALSRSPTTLDYFADAAWTDRLPALLQARLVDSFANAHRLVALAGEASVAHSDAVLVIAVRHFEAQYDGGNGPPLWRIELSADLVGTGDRKVIATRTFTGEAPAPQNNMAAIVEAADQAWHGVAKEIVDWAADSLANRPR
ncbi:MAG TPA: ABC-type transport auxiliary lipoprotein family protein [Stellaceae bacterium]|nr:ABC-type transport auxiliary lipoprotein family protein [Stellaceae bacterium]